MKPPHLSVDGMAERHSAHPTQTRSWGRITKGKRIRKPYRGSVQRRENCDRLDFTVPAIGRPKRQTGFISKGKTDEFDYEIAELGSDPEFHGGCLRHPTVSARGEEFAQSAVEYASGHPES